MFTVTLADAAGARSYLHYDPHRSTITDEAGVPIDPRTLGLTDAEPRSSWPIAARVRETEPGRKSRHIRRLKIQLGLGCNYSCSYCLQRFQPEAEISAGDPIAFLAAVEMARQTFEEGDGVTG